MRKLQIVSVLLVALAAASYSESASEATVTIQSPKSGDAVVWRNNVTGTVSDSKARVVVVIHDVERSELWVQPPVTNNQGAWSVKPYFGEDDTPSGTEYEIRAFANPATKLVRGQIKDWPEDPISSNVVRVRRR